MDAKLGKRRQALFLALDSAAAAKTVRLAKRRRAVQRAAPVAQAGTGSRRGVFLTLDAVVAMLLIFIAIMVAFSYVSSPEQDGFSAQMLGTYSQDAASVLSRMGCLSAPLHSPGYSNTTCIRQVLLATPSTVCMQVLGYGTTVQQGLVGYWKFDAGEGGSVFDWSGQGATGTIFGNATIAENGRAGEAIVLPGQDSYVSTTDFSWGYDDSFTISGWARPRTLSSGNSVIIGKYDSSSPSSSTEYALVADSAGTLRFVYWNTGGTYAIDLSSATAFQNGRWTHFAVSYDASTKNATLYVNGAAKAIAASSGSHQNRALPARVGAGYFSGNPGYFDGAIDDVRLYDRPLPQQEVSAAYSNPSNLLYAVDKPGCAYSGGEIQSLSVPFAQDAGQEENNYYHAVLKAWLKGAR